MYNNELKHYGVLGMKWGIRKADKLSSKNKKARALSREFRKNKNSRASRIRKKTVDHNIKKRTKRLDKLNFKLDMYGKATRKRVKNLDALSAVGQSLVLGPYGALRYNQFKAHNVSTGRAYVAARLVDIANLSTGRAFEIADYHGSKSRARKEKRANRKTKK